MKVRVEIVKPTLKGRGFHRLKDFCENGQAFYKSSEKSRCSSQLKISDDELVINKLPTFDDLYYSDIFSKINNHNYMLEGHSDTKDYCSPCRIVRNDSDAINTEQHSLSRDLYMLKSSYPSQYALLIDAYTKLFPEITRILPERMVLTPYDKINKVSDGYLHTKAVYYISFEDKNLSEPVDIEMLSDGARRVLVMLTEIIYANLNDNSLITIEEPENSVHPHLFQSFIEIIAQLLGRCKLIITSHSPYMMSYIDPSKIYIGVNRQPGTAEFFKLSNTGLNRLLHESVKYSISTGEYLFELLCDPENNIEKYLDEGCCQVTLLKKNTV
ncbi:MAG: ATP-binding protein [Solobacterium sp.]|nr:ATP-binding protein [Solobacterium sp.]MCH4049544.1 ATP-binding protein [Solobacterium sp.]MCH4073228.1 ATP-binding protein [Solobacterium sp.]MCI1314140.1 ATP-binding protein [Solobacterium sp.]MCI1346877.1 ATP-binding protein [Solobacterium sp.]